MNINEGEIERRRMAAVVSCMGISFHELVDKPRALSSKGKVERKLHKTQACRFRLVTIARILTKIAREGGIRGKWNEKHCRFPFKTIILSLTSLSFLSRKKFLPPFLLSSLAT
jgi:hypothetical protein